MKGGTGSGAGDCACACACCVASPLYRRPLKKSAPGGGAPSTATARTSCVRARPEALALAGDGRGSLAADGRAEGPRGLGESAYVVGRRGVGGRGCALTYQPPRLLQRPVHAVHLVVEAARVAQVVARAVAAPQRRVDGAAVDALAALREKLRHVDCANTTLLSRAQRRPCVALPTLGGGSYTQFPTRLA